MPDEKELAEGKVTTPKEKEEDTRGRRVFASFGDNAPLAAVARSPPPFPGQRSCQVRKARPCSCAQDAC